MSYADGGRWGRWSRVAGRLRSAEPGELPHRAVEQLRKVEDRLGLTAAHLPKLPARIENRPLPRFSYDAAAFAAVTPVDRERVLASARALLRDDVVLLGRRYPGRRAWDHDPDTGTQWPLVSPWAVDLHEDPRDVNLAWELHRLQHLQVLALAGRFGLDEARDAVRDDLRDWTSRFWPYLGVAWAGGIEAGLRVVSLLTIVGLVGDDDFDDDVRVRLWEMLLAHGVWLERYPSVGSGANNHRLAELVGLVVLAACAPTLPGAVRWARAEHELRALGASLFYEDGVGAEQSVTYQAFTMELLLVASRVIDLGSEVKARMAAAADFLAAIADERENRPSIGDDDEGRVLRPVIDEPRYVSSVAASARAWLAGGGGDGPPDPRAALLGLRSIPCAPPARSQTFAAGGYTVLCGDRVLAVLDHGPLGFWSTASHGHADALALCVHVDGRPILVDRGTFTYNRGGGWREYARSTAAHNTVEAGGESQSASRGLFNWGRRAQARLIDVDHAAGRATAAHDGYGPTGHTRALHVDGRVVAVVDHIDRDDVVAWWHLAPDLDVRVDGDRVRLLRGADEIGLLTVEAGTQVEVLRDGHRAGPGTHSPGYNRSEPATSLALRPAPGVRQIRSTFQFGPA